MSRPKKLKPVRGATVRLTQDLTIRGGVKFRKGLLMRIGSADGRWYLTVQVRGTNHHVTVNKKEKHVFEVVSVPVTEEDE